MDEQVSLKTKMAHCDSWLGVKASFYDRNEEQFTDAKLLGHKAEYEKVRSTLLGEEDEEEYVE